MGKHHSPRPRGYDPGGFRFPQHRYFTGPSERYDERHKERAAKDVEKAAALLSARDARIVTAGATMLAAAILRGRRGRG